MVRQLWAAHAGEIAAWSLCVIQLHERAGEPDRDDQRAVAAIDAASKWRRVTVDATGRLVKATEPAPGGGEWEGLYSYNLAGRLTQVAMPRGATTQVRTFGYNTSGYLTSLTQPENGMTKYAYNGYGLAQYKTDAKNQTVQYDYDSYRRLKEAQRFPSPGVEDMTQRTAYRNVTNPLDGVKIVF